MAKKELSVPEKHQLRIARDTLKMSEAMARIMGGPSVEEAKEIIRRLTGREPVENPVIGKAKRIKVRQPFRKSRYAWEYEGRRIFSSKGPGAVYLDEEKGTLLDLQTGEVYTKNPISRRKARTILHHGRVGGRALTTRQRGFMGARAGGYPVRRKNPTLAVFNPPKKNPDGKLISYEVEEIKYIHSDDGKAYRHSFGPNVRMLAMADGSVRIYHTSKKVWGNF